MSGVSRPLCRPVVSQYTIIGFALLFIIIAVSTVKLNLHAISVGTVQLNPLINDAPLPLDELSKKQGRPLVFNVKDLKTYTTSTAGTMMITRGSKDKENNSCFTPRHVQSHDINHTIVYIEMAWYDLHSETFYSFINEICLCNASKDPLWTVHSVPHFYIGPDGFISLALKKIIQEYNRTTCGPIYFTSEKPKTTDLTIVTTSYPKNFAFSNDSYLGLINNSNYIFICHEEDLFLEENATNVYFLTPRHKRHILPSYFPPTYTTAQVESRSQANHKPPIFLVLGAFFDSDKRNVPSLFHPLEKYQNYSFRIRFLGGEKSTDTKETMLQKLYDMFPNNTKDKIEISVSPDTLDFMTQVADADVILPLVDRAVFYNTHQGGNKLTSSVTWGLGFHKKMILYRPLADIFGIHEDNVTYFSCMAMANLNSPMRLESVCTIYHDMMGTKRKLVLSTV